MHDTLPAAFNSCDLEPIHIPGSIQPYGIMLILNEDGVVVGYAGAAGDVLDRRIEDLTGLRVASIVEQLPATSGIAVLGDAALNGTVFDAIGYRSGPHIVVELIDKGPKLDLGPAFLSQLEVLGATLERSGSLADLAARAAGIFQDLTGYSRVMIYQFVDDEAGVVLGESISDQSSSFMNHHFPATDIPRQARALYVRNRVRVIADVHYTPAPVVSASSELKSIDMSDSTLRSVSPVHIQYLKNMGVGASASMSIIKDGMLWGLAACHHPEPRTLSLTTRMACQAVATSLARQVKAREDNDLYRERIRLRAQEDVVLSRIGNDDGLDRFFASSGSELASLLKADGFAAAQGEDLYLFGTCPDAEEVRSVADHVRRPASLKPVVTSSLSLDMPAAKVFAPIASGLLAVTMSTEVPTILMWFRAEQLQTVKWAGNPHKDVTLGPDDKLSPRASFEEWSENVRGRSRDWTLAEAESAARVVKLLLEARNNARMRVLNKALTVTLKENESLIQQKDFLLGEVNHRVQNSLSLVGAFLRMQGRTASEEVREHLEQAEARLNAVGLVHRRLHQDNSVEIIDLSRYLGELVAELQTSMDRRWRQFMTLDVAPILISTDRAISVGLIINELITNAGKYAYGGEPGPLEIKVDQHRNAMRLIVADQGRGNSGKTEGTGFGSRMLSSLVQRLGGTMERFDAQPGLRVEVTANIEAVPGA